MSRKPAGRSRRPALLAWWAALVAVETLGQVALKTAGLHSGVFALDARSIHAAVSTPWLWLGLACYIAQFWVWMAILEKSTLSLAFSTSAIVFVAVMLASWAVFDDPMGWQKVLGSLVIVAGILMLGSNGTTHAPERGGDAEGTHP